jgi:phosphonate transport system substrate-binding protein
LATAFRTNRIDGVGLTALEYARLSHSQKFERLGIATSGGRVTESYVLLVRQGGRIEHLSQLKGCSLNLLDSPRASLATIWLDNELMQSSQGRCVTFFKTINTREKAQSVILPVFFGQVDACLTTSNSFQVMTEMNPQIGQQLRVLAASPEVIPSFFAFTAREGTSVQPELIRAMTRMHENVAGKQMLTLVKADRVVEGPLTWLGPSLEMIACHDRLFGEDPQ